jgi:glutathione S-transferase
MTRKYGTVIKLFVYPRLFAIPNLSPFCCKLETWLRITGVPYELVPTSDPRVGPRGKLPFIEDNGVRIADSSIIIEHLSKTRGVDPDAVLTDEQRATALLVQRTIEDHYAFVLAYTHLYREEGLQYTHARFNAVPAIVRPLVASAVHRRIKKLLWMRGTLRYSHDEIVAAAIGDWRAVLSTMSDGPFFFGEHATGVDAVVFGALASTVLTPIPSPIRDFLLDQPKCAAYADRVLRHFFPELAAQSRQVGEPAPAASRQRMTL